MHEFIDWLVQQGHDVSAQQAERITKELLELAPDGQVGEEHVEALAARYRKRFAGPRAIMTVRCVGEEVVRWCGASPEVAEQAPPAAPPEAAPPPAGGGRRHRAPQPAAPAPTATAQRREPAPAPVAPVADERPDVSWDPADGIPDLPPLPDVPPAQAPPGADDGFIGGDVDPVGWRDPFEDDPSGHQPQALPAGPPQPEEEAPMAAVGENEPLVRFVSAPASADAVDPVHGRDPFSDYPEEEALDLDLDVEAAAISDRAYYLRDEVQIAGAQAADVDLNEEGATVGEELDVRDFGAFDPDKPIRRR